MDVYRIAWLGIATPQYPAARAFFGDVLGLPVVFSEPDTTELAVGDDRVQLFAPGHPCFGRFRRHTTGPVPLFEIDDVDAAAPRLRAHGVAVLGPPESDDAWRWVNVIGPDGNLYELGSRTG